MPDNDQSIETAANVPQGRVGTSAVSSEPMPAATTQHRSDEGSFVLTVIDLLAETLEEDLTTMCPPPGTGIVPEILGRLRRTDSQLEQPVTFTYRDCTVTTTNHGVVTVRRYPPHETGGTNAGLETCAHVGH